MMHTEQQGENSNISSTQHRLKQQTNKQEIMNSSETEEGLSSLGSVQKTREDESQQQIQILGGPSASEQLLLIKGVPGQVYQLNGKVICSNKPVNNSLQSFLQFLRPGFRKFQQREIGYFIVKKREPYTGKILMLESDLYEEKFYVDWNYILLLNLDRNEYKLTTHPDLRHLKLIQPQNPSFTLLLILQSRANRPIIEKTLAENEEMYLPNACVVAMSETILVNRNKKTKQMRLKGPGMVFIEPDSKFHMNPRLKSFLITNLLMICFLGLITMVELYMMGY